MKNEKHLDDLVAIRAIMEKSTRFLSLSGLSGIFAGFYALLGAALAYVRLNSSSYSFTPPSPALNLSELFSHYAFYLGVAAVVLILSVLTGIILTMKKASKSSEKFLNPASRRLIINLLIELRQLKIK